MSVRALPVLVVMVLSAGASSARAEFASMPSPSMLGVQTTASTAAFGTQDKAQLAPGTARRPSVARHVAGNGARAHAPRASYPVFVGVTY